MVHGPSEQLVSCQHVLGVKMSCKICACQPMWHAIHVADFSWKKNNTIFIAHCTMDVVSPIASYSMPNADCIQQVWGAPDTFQDSMRKGVSMLYALAMSNGYCTPVTISLLNSSCYLRHILLNLSTLLLSDNIQMKVLQQLYMRFQYIMLNPYAFEELGMECWKHIGTTE